MCEDEYRFKTVRWLSSRLTVEEVGWALSCSPDDVHALTRERLLKPLGNPRINGRKVYWTKEILALGENQAWLNKMTNVIYKRSRDKNATRKNKRSLSVAQAARVA
jgi:ligand-binding SRPBCC domain-containing protein